MSTVRRASTKEHRLGKEEEQRDRRAVFMQIAGKVSDRSLAKLLAATQGIELAEVKSTLAGEDSEAGDDKCVAGAITEDCETKAIYKLIEAFMKDEKHFDKFDECLTKSLGLTSDD